MPDEPATTAVHEDLHAFQVQNPDFDLPRWDFHDHEAMSSLSWEGVDREAVLARLKAGQRLGRVAGSVEAADRLLAAGLDSAHRIAAPSEARFVRESGSLFADDDEARQVHRRAVAVRAKAQHLWANVRDLVASRHYRQTRFHNVQPEVADYFQAIPSYQDLFGGLDHLACPHCRSILGPAAYFVDLMRVTDEYVTYPNRHKPSGNIPDDMLLEKRRPDLFTLPLTCESTDTVIPYLDVVNHVLEQRLAGDLDGDVYPALAVAPYPFDLPVNLPLRQIRENLAALETTLADVYTTVAGPLSAGTVRAGEAGDVQLADAAASTAGFYDGMEVAVRAGPGAGQVRRIVAYDGATRTARVAPDWATVPTAESRYEVVDPVDVARERLGLSLEQYHMAVNPGVDDAGIAAAWGYASLAEVLPPFAAGPGQIGFSAGAVEVTGDGDTHFTTGLAVGDQIWCGAEVRSVATILGPAALTVDVGWTSAAQDAVYQVSRWARGTGRITVHHDSNQVTGDGDARLDRLHDGDLLQCDGTIRTVVEVRSATELLVDAPWPVDATATYTVSPTRRLDRMTTFLERSGMDRAQLDALFRQGTSAAELAAGVTQRFFVNATEEGLPPLQLVTDHGDPDNPFQRIVGLSVQRLDRLSRFVRLQRQVGWPAAELDWLLASIGSREIDAAALEAIEAARRLAASTSAPVAAVTSLWHDMKTIGHGDGRWRQDLFDQVYNPAALLRGVDPYTDPEPTPFDPARPLTWDIDERTGAGAGAGAGIRSRLLGALRVGDDDLTLTAHYVRSLQGRPGTTLVLDLPTLSWLYRLTRQAAWSSLSVDEYLTLLWLLFYPERRQPLEPPPGAVTPDLVTAARTEAAVAWLQGSPFDVYDLRYVLSGEQSAYVKEGFTVRDVGALVERLADSTQDLRLGPGSFVFEGVRAEQAADVFSALVGLGLVTALGIVTARRPTYGDLAALYPLTAESFVTEDIDPTQATTAFELLAAHVPPVLVVAPGASSGTLSETFTPETSLAFLFPDDPLAARKRDAVRAVLLAARRQIDNAGFVLAQATTAQEDQAAQGIADFLATDMGSLRALLTFSADQPDLATERVALLTPLPPDGAVPPAVVHLVTTLARGHLLAERLALTEPELLAVAADPAPFGIADTTALDLAGVQGLERFRRLTVALDDRNGVLLDYLRKPFADGVALLADLTGWSVAQVRLLADLLWPEAGGRPATRTSVEGVTRLKAVFDLGERTGTDAFLLVDLLALLHLPVGVPGGTPDRAAWAAYEARVGRTLDAFSGRYGDGFAAAFEPVSRRIGSVKRDALVGYGVWQLQRSFPFVQTPADLYQFLLIDVEMSDCASTSWIASGIGSVQLYLQRSRMNLEQGVTELDVDPVWWEWLGAYRVWEANRKIFLYPESYVQPQLRSGQSPEFRGLVEALLRSDLNESAVTDAFLAYFDELEVLADLVPVASHNASIDGSDQLFVVARPRTGPYTYFWRGHDPTRSWSPWRKVDLSIAAPEVAAVHAFGRLFLFWAELDAGKTTTIVNASADARYVRSASLRYSFLTTAGAWAQPQTLAAAVPTEVEPNPYRSMLDKPAIREALTPSALYWHQPYPFRVARGLPGTGRILVTEALTNVSGTNTRFRQEVRAGDRISVGGQTRVVGAVVSDTALAVDLPWSRSAESAEFAVIPHGDGEGFPSFDGRGAVTVTEGLAVVSGNTETRFEQEISVGDRILCANEVRTVLFIASEDSLVVQEPWTVSRSGAPYVVTPDATGTEKLLVLYGGCLATAAKVDPVPPVIPLNPARDTFVQQLETFDSGIFYSASLAKTASHPTSAVPGQVALNYAAVLDQDLQTRPTRALVSDYTYSASDNPRPYQYRVDRPERMLRAAQSDNAVVDNYWGNSSPATPPPQASSGESRNLLYNISSANSTLRNVGNQTGWAVFDNGDESFLVRSNEVGLRPLSEVVVTRPIPDPQLGEAVLLSASAFTGTPSPFDDLSYSFTRLTTTVVAQLRRRLFAGGLDRLLSLDAQRLPELPFKRFYATPDAGPPPYVSPPPPRLDFAGAYGLYFQEIFLFGPWLVADRLQAEQRFADAKRWYEHIFDPTAPQPGVADPHPNDRYWRYLPFRDVRLDSLAADLTSPHQIAAYNDEPFDPDAIARLRPAAYPKAVVLDYVDNLIRWGDRLFARDTAESIDEATQLYVLAADLLGPRPVEVGVCPTPRTRNFEEIRATYGQDIPQFLIDLENSLPAVMNAAGPALRDVPVNDVKAYFCVPENGELVGCWDRVDDRLFKIRHCMNLQGVVRRLPLFEPPIEPGQLIRARQGSRGGIPTRSGVVAPLPHYRFASLLEKAKAFTGNVVSLGASLLAALEKQDAEQLALLRTTQEAALLDLTVQMKRSQAEQVAETGVALDAVRTAAATRRAHYERLVATDLSPEELQNLDAMETGMIYNALASVARVASSLAYALPQVGSPFAMTYGGAQIGSSLAGGAYVFELGSVIAQFKAQKSITMAGYQRRREDWELQLQLADLDESAAAAQIAANEVQERVAQRDLQLTLTSVAQNREVQAFLQRKFTNQQLYQWMAGRLSEVYFQAWLLALDLARATERALQYELSTSRTFLDFAYWDSARQGLLAGEGLGLALTQMEKAYVDGNARTLEIDKTISLARLDPRALLDLERTGSCTFDLPEQLFDVDYPGHYRRKLKTVAITIPAVTGPFQTVHATLTQLSNTVVLQPDIDAIAFLLGSATTVPSPDVLRSNVAVNQQIAVSRAVNDTGLFRLDFDDPRYLPFEGTGAVSTWRLSMPRSTNRFDFASISDVLVQLSYTAVDGGEGLRRKVVKQPALAHYVGSPLLSLAQLYSQDWYAFMTDHADPQAQTLRFAVAPGVVAPHVERAQLVGFFFQLVTAAAARDTPSTPGAATPYVTFDVAPQVAVPFAPDGKGSYSHTFTTPIDMTDVVDGDRAIAFDLRDTPARFKKEGHLDPAVVENIALVLYYRATVDWAR